ncbi:MAG: cobalamin B12-binding domain-containing protein [Candidatus Omnitrophica bacterium]|nr:cobalamin B12-binding domain-containing protein [Candidatus Omnitrophota bacterium]
MSNRPLDIVLVNPGDRLRTYQSLGESLSAIEPPVWAGLMAAFLSRKGYGVAILDTEADSLSAEDAAKRIEAMRPRLVAVVVYGHQPSASTQNMTAAGAICTAVKRRWPEAKVLMVGGHVAALPERTLEEEDVDFVAGGEGLYTMAELLEALKSSSPALNRVRGLWYREDGAIRSTEPAPLLQDLNGEMPMIAWDLLPMGKYRAHNWHTLDGLKRQPYAAVYTTLGCPYHCSFCCIQAPFKSGEGVLGYKSGVNSYRFWSVEHVVNQLGLLVERYGVRNVKIADEMFVLHPKHVLGICDGIIERGYDLNIWAYARVDTVRDGMLDKLKRAGVNWLAFGIEAANARVRQDVQKGFDQDDVYRTITKVREAGIHIIGNYIFGLPEDDLRTMQETLDMALELNCEFANFYSTMAYPGSPLYRDALAQGWALPSSWAGYSQHAEDTLPLPTKHLTAGEVLRFRDEAFQTYFRAPRYLEMVERKFGAATAAHIKDMAAHKLKRQYAAEPSLQTAHSRQQTEEAPS